MGDIEGEGFADEWPVHWVAIRSFVIGLYEVTFEEYDAFAKATGRQLPADQGWGRGGRPVINVSWGDAQAYAAWLSEQTGKRYRLPTEAEWEYAARAGTETAYWWGGDVRQDGKVWANCWGCGSEWDNKQAAPVGSFRANPFGLYDMAGNVWEWTQDCWHDNYNGAPVNGEAWLESKRGDCSLRIIRGGTWNLRSTSIRPAERGGTSPAARVTNIGFRLVTDL